MEKRRIVFFDTETTGGGPADRLVALAAKERGAAKPLVNALYKPPVPISIESMAVHHITEKMAAEKPAFTGAPEYAVLKALFESGDTIAVAHNAAFDATMLAREGVKVARPLCTYKVASALDTQGIVPNYQLQYLRHYLGIELDAPAHDALGDVLVLEALFERLFAKIIEKIGSPEAALAEMLEISARPVLFVTFGFGKHRGRKIAEVAREASDYLTWLLGQKKQNPIEEENWIYTLEHHLAKRG